MTRIILLATLCAMLAGCGSVKAQKEPKAVPVSDDFVSCPSAKTKQEWWLVKDCPAVDGPTFTKIVNEWGRQMDSYEHCGDWGPWIIDRDGSIMGRYRNPPCKAVESK